MVAAVAATSVEETVTLPVNVPTPTLAAETLVAAVKDASNAAKKATCPESVPTTPVVVADGPEPASSAGRRGICPGSVPTATPAVVVAAGPEPATSVGRRGICPGSAPTLNPPEVEAAVAVASATNVARQDTSLESVLILNHQATEAEGLVADPVEVEEEEEEAVVEPVSNVTKKDTWPGTAQMQGKKVCLFTPKGFPYRCSMTICSLSIPLFHFQNYSFNST